MESNTSEPVTLKESLGLVQLIFFLKKSYLHLTCLWLLLDILFRSEIMASCWLLLFVAIIHLFRIPSSSPDLLDSICLQGAFAKTDGKPVIFGHRGAGLDMPENTLAAFRECHRNGGDGIELDVEFTSDGIAVVLHDDTVDRTTDGSGKINEISFVEARRLNAAANHPKGHLAGFQEIPTLEETCKLCLDLGLHIFIEVKSGAFSGLSNAKLAVNAICDLYTRFPNLYRTAMVCSFDPRVLFLLRLQNPDIVTALIWRPWVNSFNLDGSPKHSNPFVTAFATTYDIIHSWFLHGISWYFIGFTIVSMSKNELSYNVMQWWHERGVTPVTWTVNKSSEKKFFGDQHVPIMTDSMNEDVVEQTF